MESPFIWISIVLGGLFGYVFTWAARLAAPRIGWIDVPDGVHKQHASPTPLLGGPAVFLSVLCASAVLATADLPAFLTLAREANLPAVFLSAGLCCLLGLWDDRWPLSVKPKLVGQVVACLPFAAWAGAVQSVRLLGFELEVANLGWLFTLAWIVACVNMVNLMDGLDGLAACIGIIAMAAVAVIAQLSGSHAVTFMALTVAGCLIGFLAHNRPPAKIFLGDAGSLTVGFLVGALSCQASLKTPTTLEIGWPLAVMAIPIFDTVMAILRRTLSGKSWCSPDRSHFHHHLQERRLNRAQTLLLIAVLAMSTASAAVAGNYLGSDLLAIALSAGIITLLIAARVFGHQEVQLLLRPFRSVAEESVAPKPRAVVSAAHYDAHQQYQPNVLPMNAADALDEKQDGAPARRAA